MGVRRVGRRFFRATPRRDAVPCPGQRASKTLVNHSSVLCHSSCGGCADLQGVAFQEGACCVGHMVARGQHSVDDGNLVLWLLVPEITTLDWELSDMRRHKPNKIAAPNRRLRLGPVPWSFATLTRQGAAVGDLHR